MAEPNATPQPSLTPTVGAAARPPDASKAKAANWLAVAGTVSVGMFWTGIFGIVLLLAGAILSTLDLQQAG